MKKMAMVIGCMILGAMPLRAGAEDYATSWAISPDGKIGVAVHAYATRAEQKRFKMKVEGKARDFYPVGVMIQNYGNEAIEYDRDWIVMPAEHQGGDHVVRQRAHPYANGMASSRELRDDAALLNAALKQQRPEGAHIQRERMNDIFYLLSLEPRSSYYGVIYLEERKPNGEGSRPRSLDGISLRIRVMKEGYAPGYTATLPLSGSLAGRIVADRAAVALLKSDMDRFYIGPSDERPSNELLVGVKRALDYCQNKASTAVDKEEALGKYKEYTWSIATYDFRGDMISCELKHRARKELLNEQHAKLVEAMRHCDIPQKSADAKTGGDVPFYRIVLGTGDDRYKSGADDE